MTTVSFRVRHGRVCEVRMEGHAGFADEGHDIVCAGISSAIMLVHAFLDDVLGLPVQTTVDERAPKIVLVFPAGRSAIEEEKSQDIAAALRAHLSSLSEQYPDHISVLEV